MKTYFSYILFLLSVISLHGQVKIEVIPDKRDLQSNETLKLTVLLEIRGDEYAQQSNLRSPDFSKFNMVDSASKQNTFIDIKTKSVINQTIYQVVLEPKQTGRVKVGSFLISANDRIYKTEPFEVYITEAPKKIVAKPNIANEMYLDLEVKDRTIYKNQPTVAVLKAYSKNFDNFRSVSKIKFPKTGDVNFHQISYTKSDIEQEGNSDMSSQIIGVFLITTNESGEVKIPSVSATVHNNSSTAVLRSKNVILNVKKLPGKAPENYKNAVGNFSMTMSSSGIEDNLVGKPVDLNLTVNGEGNLRTMDLPKLAESPDYTFFPPKINYFIKNTKNGSSGSVVLNYIVIPKISGKILLKTEDFSYFDPEKRAYQNLTSDTLSIASVTEEQLSDSKTALEKVNEYTSNVLSTVHTPKIIKQQLQIPKVHEINYKIILGNLILLLGLLFFIFRYRDIKKRKSLEIKNNEPKKVENIAEAEARILNNQRFDFEEKIDELQILKDEKNYKGFFNSFEDFLAEIEIYSDRRFNSTFNNYLIQNKGAKVAEDFRNINHEFSFEKYIPLHDEEHINSLFTKLKKIVEEIKE